MVWVQSRRKSSYPSRGDWAIRSVWTASVTGRGTVGRLAMARAATTARSAEMAPAAQARRVGPAMDALELRDPLVIVSPRQRARETAELAGLKIQRTWDALAEWDYGIYEGMTTPEIRQQVPDWTVWTHPCPRGEQCRCAAIVV